MTQENLRITKGQRLALLFFSTRTNKRYPYNRRVLKASRQTLDTLVERGDISFDDETKEYYATSKQVAMIKRNVKPIVKNGGIREGQGRKSNLSKGLPEGAIRKNIRLYRDQIEACVLYAGIQGISRDEFIRNCIDARIKDIQQTPV